MTITIINCQNHLRQRVSDVSCLLLAIWDVPLYLWERG